MDKIEQELRRQLEEQLGVEFYDPDDPEVNHEVVRENVPKEAHSGLRKISVASLIQECNAAFVKLPDTDPNKFLIWNCAFALRQLLDKLCDVTVQ